MTEIKRSQEIFMHSKKNKLHNKFLSSSNLKSQTSLKCRQVPCKSPQEHASILHLNLKFLRSYKTTLRSSRITAKSCYAYETNNVRNLRCFRALLVNKRSDLCTNNRILSLFSLHQNKNTTAQSPNNLITDGSKYIDKNNDKKPF